MFEFVRLFPRRPLAVSIAAWTLFFVLQIGFLTITAYVRYVPPPEPRPLDPLWFVYTELPRVLPMAAVYSACLVFVAQVIGRFIAPSNPDNLTIGCWFELLKENPAKALTWMGVRLLSLPVIVLLLVGPIISLPQWVSTVSALLLGLLLAHLFFPPWRNWIVEGATSGDGRETLRRDVAIDAPERRGRYRRRRGRRSRGGNTPAQ